MDLGLEGKPLKTARSHLQRKITGLKPGVNGSATDPPSHGYRLGQ